MGGFVYRLVSLGLRAMAFSQRSWRLHGKRVQEQTLRALIRKSSGTVFGRDHDFAGLLGAPKEKLYELYREKVSLHSFEDFLPYIERIKKGEKDILCSGVPLKFSTSSGTTSGEKLIPMTQGSIASQLRGMRHALASTIVRTGRDDFLKGKFLFISGKMSLHKEGVVDAGRLSGVICHHMPSFYSHKRLPSNETNYIEDFDKKMKMVVEETLEERNRTRITCVAGVTPWMLHYFHELLHATGKKSISEVLPNLRLFLHGGVDYAPYHQRLSDSLGPALWNKMDFVELYVATESFIAYQDTSHRENGMLLLTSFGTFYEFIRLKDFHKGDYTRHPLWEVVLGEEYVIVLTTNGGLWSYNLTDTVVFTSLHPYRLRVVGRAEHFISAFGEHVIGQHVDGAMRAALSVHKEAQVGEFMVMPYFSSDSKDTAHHEWWIEFTRMPKNMDDFIRILDDTIKDTNAQYRFIRDLGALKLPSVVLVRRGGFLAFMKSRGKFDAQKKVPRLVNNRSYAEALLSQCDAAGVS